MSAHRDRLLSGLVGRVLDVGAGNGLNFAHYPPTGTEVVAVEPEDLLRARAEQAAAGAVVPVRVLAGHIDALPAPDGTFDAAVASLVLEDLATPLWKRCAGGCHPNRRTADAIAAAGFQIEQLDRFRFRPLRLAPTSDHILGRAHNPA